jgi:hypothetical protein
MAKYFDLFPRISYTLDNTKSHSKSYETAVHILIRIGVIKNILDKAFYYYEYTVKDGETPEIIAEKYYNDPEAHWLVLLTNNVIDPQYDWPIPYSSFNNFIESKYGSIETAKTTVHHYEKIRKTVDIVSGEETLTTYEIQYDEYLTTAASIGSPISYTLPNGKVVDVYDFYRNSVNCYDWELQQNEQKRNIKLIKAGYYSTIKSELQNLLDTAKISTRRPGIRSLI